MSDAEENPVFPIVAIGASAGGVEACLRVLGGLPDSTGMGFVVVMHLDPDQQSRLAEVFSASTKIPVAQVEDGVRVEPNRVYVIPPGMDMTFKKGHLHLAHSTRSASGFSMAIDIFMQSLAEEGGTRAVGVLLSGTGTDGAKGLAAIKVEGGITLVQEPRTARHGGMPQAAIDEGISDFTASPEEIAEELARIAGHTYFSLQEDGKGGAAPIGKEEDFQSILGLLRTVFRVDFSHYRDSTLKRRILRRMALTKQESLAEYSQFLHDTRSEVDALYRDILINVTRFFRDPEVFESLKTLVFPAILKDRSHREPIRFWVTGCSTGQEAYSLAIVLLEFLADHPNPPSYQVFASDISETGSLDKARAGLYPESIESDVSPERLTRFFTKEERGYRISKDIRARCIFAKHDLTTDPPFSKVDLVTCRNVLIYMAPPLQRKILPIFHYALMPERFLLLGPSETIGRDSDLFGIVDREKKLYVRKSTTARLPSFEIKHQPVDRLGVVPRTAPMVTHVDFQREADRILLGRFAPAGVLVNANLDILQFRGRTRPYLEPPQGEASFSLLKMANEGLFAEVYSAIQEAQAQNGTVRRHNINIRDDGRLKVINLEVIPVSLPTSGEACYLILFDDTARAEAPSSRGASGDGPVAEEDLAQLRKENNSLREYLQLVREQHEASIEELKSSNEELLSSNEELQSTNEELETAKEEYQSANEELTTLNEEMGMRNQEMVQLNNDLNNLLNTLSVPIIMVGKGARIRRFTPAAEKYLHLEPSDVGRPLGEIKLGLQKGPDIERAVQDVMMKGLTAGYDVQDGDARWHSLQIHPYRTSENRIEGAVIILSDIDALKRAHERLYGSEAYARAIVNTIREPLITLREELREDKGVDLRFDMRVDAANPAFYQAFGLTPEQTEGQPIHSLGGGRWNIPELRKLLEETLTRNRPFEEFVMEHEFPGIGLRTLRLNARKLVWSKDKPATVLLVIEDITLHRRAEEVLRDHSRKLEQAVRERTAELQDSTNQMEAFSFSVSHDLRAPLRAMQGYADALMEDRGAHLDDVARGYIAKIAQSGARMDRLIQDVLTYSRMALGEVKIDEVDTDRLARELVAQLPELQAEGIKVSIESPLAPVMAHEASLGQCLSNLLVNAVKFVSPGVNPRVRVRTERIQSLVRIWVEDNGIGIDPEYHQKIFGMFEKLHDPGVYIGTGIGLSIVKKAAERMGGMAGVDSVPGHGSRFWIQLPGRKAQ